MQRAPKHGGICTCLILQHGENNPSDIRFFYLWHRDVIPASCIHVYDAYTYTCLVIVKEWVLSLCNAYVGKHPTLSTQLQTLIRTLEKSRAQAWNAGNLNQQSSHDIMTTKLEWGSIGHQLTDKFSSNGLYIPSTIHQAFQHLIQPANGISPRSTQVVARTQARRGKKAGDFNMASDLDLRRVFVFQRRRRHEGCNLACYIGNLGRP